MKKLIGAMVPILAALAIFPEFLMGAAASPVAYKDLATTRLPYGQAITISGGINDFVATDPKLGNVVISTWSAIKQILVVVTVSGLSPRTAVKATVTGTTWTVAVDQFPENATVKFDFQVDVDLNGDKAGQIVDSLIKDDKFNTAVTTFFTSATKASVAATTTARTAFIASVAPMVKSQLPGFLTPTDLKPITDSLVAADATAKISSAGAWANVKSDLDDLVTIINGHKIASLAGVTATTAPTDAFNKLKAITTSTQVTAALLPAGIALTPTQLSGLLETAQTYVSDYQGAVDIFTGLVADLPVSLQLTDLSTVQDFSKYAGIDVGALYSPPAKTLRSFFTINVYLGAVEDTPAPAVACQNGVSAKSLQGRIRQIEDAQAKVTDARAVESQDLASFQKSQAALDAFTKANAPQDQIAKATQDRDSAQLLANAATAARQQVEKIAANAISPPSGRACTFTDSVLWQTFQQRFSISGGISLGDISGQQNPPFASNYAFIAGGGWRINKYVRAFVGDLLYRNKYTDRVNHTGCFGFSVDFTALGNITSIFGKAK